MTSDAARRSTISAHQGRREWTAELKEVLRRARHNGDTRRAVEIISEWRAFRKKYEG